MVVKYNREVEICPNGTEHSFEVSVYLMGLNWIVCSLVYWITMAKGRKDFSGALMGDNIPEC